MVAAGSIANALLLTFKMVGSHPEKVEAHHPGKVPRDGVNTFLRPDLLASNLAAKQSQGAA